MSTFKIILDNDRKGVIHMRQLFYTVARHRVMLKALLVLTIMAAAAIVGGAPGGFDP